MASPLMSLPIPTVAVTLGPQYATDVNSSLTILDSHNHAPGSGSQITPAGMNINANLPFNSNRATTLNAVQLNSLGSPITGAGNLQAVYSVSGDLYYTNSSGVAVQITSGGALSAVGLGAITGDYSSTGADLTYSNTSKTYIFKQGTPNTTRPAAVTVGQVNITDATVPVGQAVSLSAPAGLSASYTVNLPSALPASTLPLRVDNSGTASFSQIVDNDITTGTITRGKLASGIACSIIGRSANTIGPVADIQGSTNDRILTRVANVLAFTQLNDNMVPAASISGSKISSGTITSLQILDGTITGTDIAASTITGSNIATNTITGSNIAPATIPGANIALATITGANIATNTITAVNIAPNTIPGANIAFNTIAANNIVNNTITQTQIAGRTLRNYNRQNMFQGLTTDEHIGFYQAATTNIPGVLTTIYTSGSYAGLTPSYFTRPIMVGMHGFDPTGGTPYGVQITSSAGAISDGWIRIRENNTSYTIAVASFRARTGASGSIEAWPLNVHGLMQWAGISGSSPTTYQFAIQGQLITGTNMDLSPYYFYAYEV